MKIILACLFLVGCGTEQEPSANDTDVNSDFNGLTIEHVIEHQGQARLNTEDL